MLTGISPRVGPDPLRTLAAMGQGDGLACVDANDPAEEHARRRIRADGVSLCALLEEVPAILSRDHAAQAIRRTPALCQGHPARGRHRPVRPRP